MRQLKLVINTTKDEEDFLCPYCGTELRVVGPMHYSGTVTCQVCEKKFFLNIWVEFNARTLDKA